MPEGAPAPTPVSNEKREKIPIKDNSSFDSEIKRKLISKDGQIFEVDKKSLQISILLKNLVNAFPKAVIVMNNIDGKLLNSIISYMDEYQTKKPKEIPKPLPSPDLKLVLSKFDFEFINSFSLEECIDLVNAADFLYIIELINLSSAKIASEMINCSIEEVREKFGIVPDMTEEEMAEDDTYPLD